MRRLGTYRQVPPIALESWAISVVVLAAYVGAAETGLPESASPVAFAVALFLALKWMVNAGWMTRALRVEATRKTWVGVEAAVVVLVTVPVWVWTVSDAAAMRVWVGWILTLALLRFLLIGDPEHRARIPSPWARIGRFSALALTLEAAGRGLIAATGLLLARLGDPLVFVAFMTFGANVFIYMINWAILLAVAVLSRDDDA